MIAAQRGRMKEARELYQKALDMAKDRVRTLPRRRRRRCSVIPNISWEILRRQKHGPRRPWRSFITRRFVLANHTGKKSPPVNPAV
jgi:hypothetical protein